MDKFKAEYADQRGNIARILRYGMNYTSGSQAGSGVIDDLQFITEPGRNRTPAGVSLPRQRGTLMAWVDWHSPLAQVYRWNKSPAGTSVP